MLFSVQSVFVSHMLPGLEAPQPGQFKDHFPGGNNMTDTLFLKPTIPDRAHSQTRQLAFTAGFVMVFEKLGVSNKKIGIMQDSVTRARCQSAQDRKRTRLN